MPTLPTSTLGKTFLCSGLISVEKRLVLLPMSIAGSTQKVGLEFAAPSKHKKLPKLGTPRTRLFDCIRCTAERNREKDTAAIRRATKRCKHDIRDVRDAAMRNLWPSDGCSFARFPLSWYCGPAGCFEKRQSVG